ncbi:hypothetical protein DPMN_057904 [Dreissena polymorpha]|uniref:Uncharacterized protein n=1 Tax=Dreissena polymorpha TaxID=45954 RepID=A0A9D4C159_DREPO|nr:hypothetical protein DPMN_057904 [Dreissena polymorpha]
MWCPREYHLHIKNLEKLAVFLAVSRFQHIFATPVSTDNTSVVVYIQAQGCMHDHPLYLETRNVLVLCKNFNISLSFKHIPCRLNALSNSVSCKHQFLLPD